MHSQVHNEICFWRYNFPFDGSVRTTTRASTSLEALLERSAFLRLDSPLDLTIKLHLRSWNVRGMFMDK